MSANGIELRGKCADTQVDPYDVAEQLVQLTEMDPEDRKGLSLEIAKHCLNCTVENPGAPDIVSADRLRSDPDTDVCPISARRAALLAVEEHVELVPRQCTGVSI